MTIGTHIRMIGACAAAFLVAAGIARADVGAKPQRIVSLNLCTDQLVLLMADRTRIASLSFLVADPYSSTMPDAATGLYLNHGFVEEILPLKPDIVLAATFTARSTVSLLRRLGYRVEEIPPDISFDDVRSNIRRVADLIGEPERGAQLIADLDRELSAIPGPSEPRPTVALYWANGYSSGAGTLADTVVQLAGFRNLAAASGAQGTIQLPLETLLSSQVDLLVLGSQRRGNALAYASARHPALRVAFAKMEHSGVADDMWVCGLPSIATAIAKLAARREVLTPHQAKHDENGK